jgi:DMSO/TMAO reductase YedYZ molybdopterin-dependent catalytic subunit
VALPEIKVKEITPTESFYHVSKNFFDPTPSASGWKLEINGMVDSPYSLTYSELVALPAIEVITGMMCISNPLGGGLIGNAQWKGVRLADLIQRAGPQKGAVDVVLQAVDGYSDSITYKKAIDPNVMLVWEMNGETLKPTHGFPARLLVPGIYGMKHVKWITSVQLVNHDFKGFWQQPDQGWSDPAPVNTMSRIDFPAAGNQALQKLDVSGIAFAGDRSISKVEVSTDGGKTWHEAYVRPPLSGTSWVVWGYVWTPPAPGKYKVMVRATDGTGKLQSARWTDPYPNGGTGYHSVTFNIRG